MPLLLLGFGEIIAAWVRVQLGHKVSGLDYIESATSRLSRVLHCRPEAVDTNPKASNQLATNTLIPYRRSPDVVNADRF